MKKNNILVLLLAFLLACSADIQDFNQLQNRDGIYFQVNTTEPFTGKTESRYANGNLELEGNIERGYKEGIWTTYYENTQKKSQGKYATSLKDGTWMYWQENGKESSKENYNKGILLSENTNELKQISEPLNRAADSSLVTNSSVSVKTGLEVKEKAIKMSQLSTSIKKGKVRKFYNGEAYTGAVIDYDENNVKTISGYYQDGLRSGKWTYFYPSGDVKDVKFFD